MQKKRNIGRDIALKKRLDIWVLSNLLKFGILLFSDSSDRGLSSDIPTRSYS